MPMISPLVYAALKDGRLDGQENPVPTIANQPLIRSSEINLTLSGHFFARSASSPPRDVRSARSDGSGGMITAAKRRPRSLAGRSFDARKLDQLRNGGMEIVEKIDRQPSLTR